MDLSQEPEARYGHLESIDDGAVTFSDERPERLATVESGFDQRLRKVLDGTLRSPLEVPEASGSVRRLAADRAGLPETRNRENGSQAKSRTAFTLSIHGPSPKSYFGQVKKGRVCATRL